jgi:tripartite-type tricarboxylate transporter receptor subunit TctC
MEVFMQTAGLKLVHIPYKGAGAAMNDLVAGQVQVFMAGLLTALPHVKSGRIRALGVSRATRAIAAPHIPTLSEAGVPGLNEGGQYGIVVPVQVDEAIIRKLWQDIVAAMRQPAVVERMRTEGAEVVVNAPREYAEVLANDVRKWSRVIRAAGIPVQ